MPIFVYRCECGNTLERLVPRDAPAPTCPDCGNATRKIPGRPSIGRSAGTNPTPGGVSTPMNENEPEGGVVPLTPLGRRAHVSEISGAVAFLASDDASFVTGTELVIDGGYLAR